MSVFVETGNACETRAEVHVEWKITAFNILEDTNFQSPVIFFNDSRFRLKMFPKGTKEFPESVVMFLEAEYFQPSKVLKLNLAIKKAVGVENFFTGTYNTSDCIFNTRNFKFISHLVLMQRKSELMPSGVLTITCALTSMDPQSTEVSLGNRLWKLRQDLRTMLKEKKGTDFTLKVGGSEFPVHRLILERRCGYFAGMFGNRFQENETGVAEIDDIEKDVFQCILTYLYTGEVEGISNENVYKIYVAADKLLLEELEKFCVEYMKRNLSRESICGAIATVEKYGEVGLEDDVFDYFIQHADQSIESDEWKKFKVGNEALVLNYFEKLIVKIIKLKKI